MQELINFSKEFNIDISENAAGKFQQFYDCIKEGNKIQNLTAIENKEEVVIKHFLDSMAMFMLSFDTEKKRIADVGSGAGFPGIPISIIEPTSEVVLIESENRKCVFLKECIDRLGLKNTDIIHGRAEELGRDDNFREGFDITLARAVTKLNGLSEYLLPLTKVGGCAVCYKGAGADEEIAEAENAIETLGGETEGVLEFVLPKGMGTRSLIVIRKIKPTPSAYPRRAGIPVKRPIK